MTDIITEQISAIADTMERAAKALEPMKPEDLDGLLDGFEKSLGAGNFPGALAAICAEKDNPEFPQMLVALITKVYEAGATAGFEAAKAG